MSIYYMWTSLSFFFNGSQDRSKDESSSPNNADSKPFNLIQMDDDFMTTSYEMDYVFGAICFYLRRGKIFSLKYNYRSL